VSAVSEATIESDSKQSSVDRSPPPPSSTSPIKSKSSSSSASNRTAQSLLTSYFSHSKLDALSTVKSPDLKAAIACSIPSSSKAEASTASDPSVLHPSLHLLLDETISFQAIRAGLTVVDWKNWFDLHQSSDATEAALPPWLTDSTSAPDAVSSTSSRRGRRKASLTCARKKPLLRLPKCWDAGVEESAEARAIRLESKQALVEAMRAKGMEFDDNQSYPFEDCGPECNNPAIYEPKMQVRTVCSSVSQY
jgi:hypothetical protein